MADRSRYSRRPDQLLPNQAGQLPGLSLQHIHKRPSGFHRRHHPAHYGGSLLFPGLSPLSFRRDDLRLRSPLTDHGGADAILHHLQPGHHGVLDSRDHHRRFHRFLLRILPRRPNVPGGHHARRYPGSHEMASLLLRTLLSDRDFHGTPARRRNGAGSRDSNRLAHRHLGHRPLHVEARAGALSGRGWVRRVTSRTTVIPSRADGEGPRSCKLGHASVVKTEMRKTCCVSRKRRVRLGGPSPSTRLGMTTATRQSLFTPFATGRPCSFHARIPPASDRTFSYPIFCKLSATSAERLPPPQ